MNINMHKLYTHLAHLAARSGDLAKARMYAAMAELV